MVDPPEQPAPAADGHDEHLDGGARRVLDEVTGQLDAVAARLEELDAAAAAAAAAVASNPGG
jgi:hypothetical protein